MLTRSCLLAAHKAPALCFHDAYDDPRCAHPGCPCPRATRCFHSRQAQLAPSRGARRQ
ncbi:hypothetical protein ACFPRL_36555 [Pseudoclavibacter helvolus]